jgi:hypothetical protein
LFAFVQVQFLADATAKYLYSIQRADSIPQGGEDDAENLANSWRLPCVPVCVKESLTKLVFKDYKGGAELALIQGLLKAARSLLSVTLHLHPTMWASLLLPEDAIASLKDSPRASKKCKITVAQVPTAASPLESLLCDLCLM